MLSQTSGGQKFPRDKVQVLAGLFPSEGSVCVGGTHFLAFFSFEGPPVSYALWLPSPSSKHIILFSAS